MIELRQYPQPDPIVINIGDITCIEQKRKYSVITLLGGKVVKVYESVAEIEADIEIEEQLAAFGAIQAMIPKK